MQTECGLLQFDPPWPGCGTQDVFHHSGIVYMHLAPLSEVTRTKNNTRRGRDGAAPKVGGYANVYMMCGGVCLRDARRAAHSLDVADIVFIFLYIVSLRWRAVLWRCSYSTRRCWRYGLAHLQTHRRANALPHCNVTSRLLTIYTALCFIMLRKPI